MSVAFTRSRRSLSHCGRALGIRMAVAGAVLAGCRPRPDITVAGSYFPSWMAALVLGVLGTILFWQLFTRTGIDPYLWPRPVVVYTGLMLLITLVFWLGVFRG